MSSNTYPICPSCGRELLDLHDLYRELRDKSPLDETLSNSDNMGNKILIDFRKKYKIQYCCSVNITTRNENSRYYSTNTSRD